MRLFGQMSVPGLLVTLALTVWMMPAQAGYRQPLLLAQAQTANGEQRQMTAREAAAKARAQYGGKVLKVEKTGGGFRVRLLQDSGRVITVTIRG